MPDSSVRLKHSENRLPLQFDITYYQGIGSYHKTRSGTLTSSDCFRFTYIDIRVNYSIQVEYLFNYWTIFINGGKIVWFFNLEN